MDIQALNSLDHAITLAVNSFNCPLSDRIWAVFSGKEVWYPLYALVTFELFRRLGWKKGLAVFASMVLTIVACDQFSNLIKDLVRRPRPCWDDSMMESGLHLLDLPGGLYGFFSAHSTNSFGFAASSICGYRHGKPEHCRTYAVVIVIWAMLVSISRIFVGAHYLGDVLTGIVVGIIFGVMIGKLAGLLIKKL